VAKAMALPALLPKPASASLRRYPYLQNVSSTRASIVWTTETEGIGAVRYSRDTSMNRAASAIVRELTPGETDLGSSYYRHTVHLNNLEPGAKYYYRVEHDGVPVADEPTLTFQTPSSGPFRFLAFGDSGTGRVQQLDLAAQMMREQVNLVLHLGDIAYMAGSFAEYEAFYFNVYRDMMRQVPFFPCPGNHSYWTREAFPYLTMHDLPQVAMAPATEKGRYYSFDWHHVHFVAVDTNAPLSRAVQGRSPMLQWLDQDLAATRQYWKVVFFHHPPFAGGPNETDPLSILAREHVVPILERHGVQLVLCGHEHSYQRSHPLRQGEIVEPGKGTIYMTSGGGGAGLYPVHPKPFIAFGQSIHEYLRLGVSAGRINIEAVLATGDVLDRTEVAPSPELSAPAVVNSAFAEAQLCAGGLISIYGRNFAPENEAARNFPLPASLGTVSLSLRGQNLPLLFVSPYQVNAQLPFDFTGDADLRLTTPNGSASVSIAAAEAAPGILAVAHPTGELVSASSPARPGQVLIIYAAGLGPLDGEIRAGQAAPSDRLLNTRLSVRVKVGGAMVTPAFAGLVPGLAGLYQVNVQLPSTLSPDTSLAVHAGSATSNWVRLAV